MKQNVKKLIATGSIVTTMLMVNAGIASAQYIPDIAATDTTVPPRQSFGHEKRFEDKLSFLALKAGLDPETLSSTDSRTTIKQLLKDHGITDDELQQVFGNRHGRTKNGRHH